MTIYITDNPLIHKEMNSFLLYQIFDWRITVNDKGEDLSNEFSLKKRFKTAKLRNELKLASKIVLITAESNYKLIYDAIFLKEQLKIELNIYSWSSWYKRKKIIPGIRNTKKMFHEYIQRGYLTKLVYKQISSMNLQRIEQFISIVSINILKRIDCNKDEFENNSEDNFKTNNAIRILLSQGYSLRKIVDKLIYHSRKNDITDPFIGTFSFISKNNSFYKKITNGIENINDNHCLQLKLINSMSMIPYTDVLKTLRFLEKNDLIDMLNMTTDHKFLNEDLVIYSKYMIKSNWESIYNLKTFHFSGVFPSIDITEDKYECPLCGSSVLRESPKHFFCSDITCKLFINRIINPGGIKKQITEPELIRLIKHGNTIIKNKIGGYNRFILRRTNDHFKIIPQIEENIKDED